MAYRLAHGAPLGSVSDAIDGMRVDAIVRWLFTPISGSSEHHIATSVAWHGRLMVLGMGLLMPPVIIVARFYKITPRQDWPNQLDNPFWFVTHRRWGHIVGLVVAGGFAFALADFGWRSPWRSLHTTTGWIILALIVVQIVGSWLRGTHGGPIDPFTRQTRPPEEWHGDHFSMTGRRRVFEYIHKSAGYILLALSLVAIPTGLIAADAPRWMPITMGAWWLLMFIGFAWLQRAGRCVDTYQAIWGINPDLPGNRRQPIGFGIRRTRQGEILRSE
jgi:hypothetical protein